MSHETRPIADAGTDAPPGAGTADADDAGGTAEAAASSCEVRTPPARLDRSRLIRYDGSGWDGVRVQPYKADGMLFEAVTRRVLAAPDTAGFELRYFEIEPGGRSTWERHRHVHVVICLRGRGCVRLGSDEHDLGFGDVVYVAPDEPHQFRNPRGEPFGFLCIVDRDRDRPVPLEPHGADADGA